MKTKKETTGLSCDFGISQVLMTAWTANVRLSLYEPEQ